MEKNRKNSSEPKHRPFSETFEKIKSAVNKAIAVGLLSGVVFGGYKIYEKVSEKDPVLSLFPEKGVAKGSEIPVIDGVIVFNGGSFDRPTVIDAILAGDDRQIVLGTESTNNNGDGTESSLDITQVTEITPEDFADGSIIFTDSKGASIEVADFENFVALLANETKIVEITEESDPLTGENYFVSTDGSAISNRSLAEEREMTDYKEYLRLLEEQKGVFDKEYRQLSESDKKDLVPLKTEDGWPKIYDGIASIPIGTEIISNGQRVKSQTVIMVANPVVDKKKGMMFTDNNGKELSLSRVDPNALSGVSFIQNGTGDNQGILAVLSSGALKTGTVFAKRGEIRNLYVNNGDQAIGFVLVDSLRKEAMIKIGIPGIGDNSQVLTYYRINIDPLKTENKK